MSDPLLLTLKLDPITFGQTNALRQQYFPPERNVVPAHIILFHQLPENCKSAVVERLRSHCEQVTRFPLALPTLTSLGNGVAIKVESPALMHLQKALAEVWEHWLIPQDRQGYRPHITIQNKVKPAEAKRVYESLQKQWQPLQGWGEGLLLWSYRRGPWELIDEFCFVDAL